MHEPGRSGRAGVPLEGLSLETDEPISMDGTRLPHGTVPARLLSMEHRRSWYVASLACVSAALLALTSCRGLPVGPEVINSTLHLSATELRFGETFVATLTLENPTNREVTLTSPEGCLALPSVYREGQRLEWDGTSLGCLTAVTHHTVPAHGTLVRAFELRAALLGGPDPSDYEIEPEPGVYELRMEIYVLLPDLDTEFLVVS